MRAALLDQSSFNIRRTTDLDLPLPDGPMTAVNCPMMMPSTPFKLRGIE